MSSSSSCDTCCTSGNVKINIKLFHFNNGVSICGSRSTTGVRQGQGQIRTDHNRPINVFPRDHSIWSEINNPSLGCLVKKSCSTVILLHTEAHFDQKDQFE